MTHQNFECAFVYKENKRVSDRGECARWNYTRRICLQSAHAALKEMNEIEWNEKCVAAFLARPKTVSAGSSSSSSSSKVVSPKYNNISLVSNGTLRGKGECLTNWFSDDRAEQCAEEAEAEEEQSRYSSNFDDCDWLMKMQASENQEAFSSDSATKAISSEFQLLHCKLKCACVCSASLPNCCQVTDCIFDCLRGCHEYLMPGTRRDCVCVEYCWLLNLNLRVARVIRDNSARRKLIFLLRTECWSKLSMLQ